MNSHTACYGCISVRGEDAAAFLNAQLTRRVDDLAEHENRLAAWCNAKGRVQALFRVSRTGSDCYALRLPAGLMPPILTRLKMFVLRSRVQLEQQCVDNSLPVVEPSRLEEIRAGIPEVYPETREQFLPQMINLDRLGAIDFRKGCYPGQEIVARSQYLGQIKRRMHLFGADTGTVPVPGTRLAAAGESGGIVVDAMAENGGQLILAVIPTEAASLDWQIEAQGQPLKQLTLPYPLT